MNWSAEQTNALDKVNQWLASQNKPYFSLFGYAGTGKTTLARHLADSSTSDVVFAAYTGKAASVMRAMGCRNATTIHKLIYNPTTKSRAKLLALEEEASEFLSEPDSDTTSPKYIALLAAIKAEKERLKSPSFSINPDSPLTNASLAIIDECSMIDERIAHDLLSFNVPILVLGDPGQLPPVKGSGYFVSGTPDVMLTEIHRQAKDNPIIAIATKIRLGEKLEDGAYGSSLVTTSRCPERVMQADQLIVGSNETRRKCNMRFRSILGYVDSPIPTEGERLVCLRNDHNLGLLNGTMWSVVSSFNMPEEDTVALNVTNEDAACNINCVAWTHHFQGKANELDHWCRRDNQEFDYGYALTCHKSQGSQWKHVAIVDESSIFRSQSRQWLYTAVTRASETVTLIRKA